jgi:tetratricopeptide (TPR) repeat protein
MDGGGGHPDANRLAEYADGILSESARADVEHHLGECAECRDVLADTAAFRAAVGAQDAEAGPASRLLGFPRRRVLAVFGGLAAAALLILTVRVIRPEWLDGPRDDSVGLQALIAAEATAPTRAVDGRLTGGFAYAPPLMTRGTSIREISPETRIAAAQLEKRALQVNSTVVDRVAAGVAQLVTGDLDRAVDTLERASSVSPDPKIASDLAAAYLARGATRPDDLNKALRAAERAVQAPDAPIEAWFNRALALERLGLREPASAAWKEYLERDPSSPWAAEARTYLQRGAQQ